MRREIWRLLDTGLRSAGQNVALNRALLEARRADETPSTLRFLRHTPAVLLGSQQSAQQELDAGFCSTHRIEVQRRVTSGAAFYVDAAQLGWELYLHQRDVGNADMQACSRRVCHAVAAAISALGLDARYRARSDIEVDGRRIGGAVEVLEGSALLVQGVLWMDLDLDRIAGALRTPVHGRPEQARAALRERVAGLKELLGRPPDAALVRRNIAEAFESEFDVEFSEGDLTLSEHSRYEAALREAGTPDWVNLVARPVSESPLVEGLHSWAGGVLRAHAIIDLKTRTFRQVWFTGDARMSPQRTVADLEAALRDVPFDSAARKIALFFSGRQVRATQPAAADFTAVLRTAILQPLFVKDA